MPEDIELQRICPSCGEVCTMDPYDIGDGPEFSCVVCEWCWGALGQPLTMKPVLDLAELARRHWGDLR